MFFWLLLLLLCNYPLFQGRVAERLIFSPEAVASGEWHRLFLGPFTHVSWYHLGLDAAAFLLLWNGVQENRHWGRFLYFIGCWSGSLIAPLLFSAQLNALGLCGLSGIAHGLFAVTTLEMIFSKADKISRLLGRTLLVGLLTKVGAEIGSGGMVMSTLHLGDVGVPIVSSHLGGVVGGGLAFGLVRLLAKPRRRLGSKDNR